MEKKIEILSQLTVDEINELRLFISLARYNSYDKAIEWANALNQAMERKQENYWTNFDLSTKQKSHETLPPPPHRYLQV